MQKDGKHLLGLINDVLDISKIEAGQLSLTFDEYSLQGLVEAVIISTGVLAQAKGIELKSVISADLPVGYGDERRLTQVLLNIVGNAIKFTDTGSVEVHASAIGDHFVIAVRDTGPGIPAGDHARIFEDFQQIDNSITRQKGGTGLRRAVARRHVLCLVRRRCKGAGSGMRRLFRQTVQPARHSRQSARIPGVTPKGAVACELRREY